ncbi:MAG: glycosyltransferase [Hungatella sp.]|nr:glycosyltransferase [Hungatella sp.]
MNLEYSVCVMMSTYNGETYLPQQIESILSQEKIKINLLIRDDESTDNTLNIIEKYRDDKRVKYYSGKNIGPAFSFIDLLFAAEDYDYYAFADQDDYWEANKIYEAVKVLESYKEFPALYSSLTEVVDENLNFKNRFYGTKKQYNFLTQLARSNAIGCTMVFNKRLFCMTRVYRPQYICMHDQWVNIICKALDGIEIKDSRSFVKYRQHSSNVLGAEQNFVRRLKKSALFAEGNSRYNQAYELIQGYKEYMRDEYYRQIMDVIQYKTCFASRIRCIVYNYNTGRPLYNMLIRLSFIRGKF